MIRFFIYSTFIMGYIQCFGQTFMYHEKYLPDGVSSYTYKIEDTIFVYQIGLMFNNEKIYIRKLSLSGELYGVDSIGSPKPNFNFYTPVGVDSSIIYLFQEINKDDPLSITPSFTYIYKYDKRKFTLIDSFYKKHEIANLRIRKFKKFYVVHSTFYNGISEHGDPVFTLLDTNFQLIGSNKFIGDVMDITQGSSDSTFIVNNFNQDVELDTKFNIVTSDPIDQSEFVLYTPGNYMNFNGSFYALSIPHSVLNEIPSTNRLPRLLKFNAQRSYEKSYYLGDLTDQGHFLPSQNCLSVTDGGIYAITNLYRPGPNRVPSIEIIKLDTNLNILWKKDIKFSVDTTFIVSNMIIFDNGSLALCGQFFNLKQFYRYNAGLIVLDSLGNLTNTIQIAQTSLDQLLLYPSPTTGVLKVSGFVSDNQNLYYKLFNCVGQQISEGESQVLGSKIILNFSSIPSGHYILSIRDEKGKYYLPAKFVKIN